MSEALPRRGVIVIDRDAEFVATLHRELARHGWDVRGADSLAAARRELVGTADVVAAIVDLEMPGLEGAKALRALAEICPEVLRCVTTSTSDAHAVMAFRRLNSTPLFAKPVLPCEIERVLREHARSSGVFTTSAVGGPPPRPRLRALAAECQAPIRG